jgi:hypothetical protein
LTYFTVSATVLYIFQLPAMIGVRMETVLDSWAGLKTRPYDGGRPEGLQLRTWQA